MAVSKSGSILGDEPGIEMSRMSRDVTLDGIIVKVRIYRLEGHPKWMLVVVSADNTYTFFDATFEKEAEAFAAFQITVQEEGMATFLDRGDTETLH